MFNLLQIWFGKILLKQRLKHQQQMDQLKIIKNYNYQSQNHMKNINHFQEYMKDIKIFQHMILIILVIYQSRLYQIMIISNIHQDMFNIRKIYGNISDHLQKRIRFITNKV